MNTPPAEPHSGPLLLRLLILLLAATGAFPACLGDDGRVQLQRATTGWNASVSGDADDEWWLEASTDLRTWIPVAGVGPLLSGRTNAAVATVAGGDAAPAFYRARRTGGLYDPEIVREVRLTFAEANWQTILANNYGKDTNLVGTLQLNGRTYPGVGVRYKGNTSYTQGGNKKSVNIKIDQTDPDLDAMRYSTIILNNAAGDESVMREPLFFTIMRRYAVCPAGNFARLYVNGVYWGLYSNAQQEDKQLVDEFFPGNDGDRWRAPNAPGMAGGGTGGTRPGPGGGFPPGGGGGFPGGGGGFTAGTSALMYLGPSIASYTNHYILKSDDTNAWSRLVKVITALHQTPDATFRESIEDVLAVDRWLWFLAAENVFADDDSYFNKGADYMAYLEPETGRLHPIEHDGNESFVAGDVQLSPVIGAGNTNRPVLNRFLAIPELRQRYLAHLRTILEESFRPAVLHPLIDEYSARSKADLVADTKKSYTMAAYTNDLVALKSFVTQRYAFLTNHAELRPLPPRIGDVLAPAAAPTADVVPFVTAAVAPSASEGIASVWLYFRPRAYGRFTSRQMFDDGQHGDGASGDGVYGAATTNYPAGTKVRFYVEARSGNAARAAAFSPARAEEETHDYRVALSVAATTPVVINEFMASNAATQADPQGEFDDWIELRNLTDQEVDLTGYYLTDEPNNPRKWAFPDGTRVAPGGFLIVWADEDGKDAPGLHASFKLAAGGEQLLLIDTDARLNAVLDSVTFGSQSDDRSFGRSASNPDVLESMDPTPGLPNR